MIAGIVATGVTSCEAVVLVLKDLNMKQSPKIACFGTEDEQLEALINSDINVLVDDQIWFQGYMVGACLIYVCVCVCVCAFKLEK